MFKPLLLCAFSILILAGCSGEKTSENSTTETKALVRLTESSYRDIPCEVEAVGTVEPSASVNIVSRTAGELEQILVKDGDTLKQGQLLFVIEKDPSEIVLHQALARLESDRARLTKAEDDYARSQKMTKGGFSSVAENDAARVNLISARAAVKEDEAAVEKARLDLSYCEIRAPMDGRAGEVKVDRGNVVTPQTSLLMLDTVHPADITFSISEKYLPQVRRSMERGALRVSAVSKEGTPVSGTVIFVGNVAPATGTVPLKARFENAGSELWAGEFLRVRITLDVREHAVTVPSRAVMIGPDGPLVFVVGDDGKAHIRLVETDVENDGVTVVSKGLEAGEKVVLEGHVRLKDGVEVRLAEDDAEKNSPKTGAEG
ncbi:efflux RND transporter periplasmic adaptor subunit [uncultured Mailhella sp.]|uniref:efflux RND transporter periplasmic adaptor subunit n=1 Tax=uncultured Mailhella sp. TaxID=1981031 RepID=UPI00260E076C|nr:efflux RND transporter periplasmic adaptor subunit [uncultured Mailhella sp.]